MNFPMVSVIVPVYNAETTIGNCVNSICSNHYHQLEIILVDDGSTDGSGKLCDKLAASNERIKVIHKPNGGVGSARNEGLNAATGTYVMFVDSDDTVSGIMYETMIGRAILDDSDCAVCNAVYVYAHEQSTVESHVFGNQVIQGSETIDSKIIQPLLTPGNNDAALMQSTCNKLYRLSTIRENGLSFSYLPYAEDWLFNVEFFLKAEKISFVEDALYFYDRTTAGSLSKSWRKDGFKDSVWIQNKIVQLFPDKYTQDGFLYSVLGIQMDCLKNFAYYCGTKGFWSYASELFCDAEIKRAYLNIAELPKKYRWPGKCLQHGWRNRYCLWCLYAVKTTLFKHELKSAYRRLQKDS